MHKYIRRSIAVAATATGMWAIGTAAANISGQRAVKSQVPKPPIDSPVR